MDESTDSTTNRPFAASHSRGTKLPRWRATKGLNGNFLCLSCPRATFALQYSGFVPREWLAAKGLFPHFSRLGDSKNERIRRARDTWKERKFFRKQSTESTTSSPSFS